MGHLELLRQEFGSRILVSLDEAAPLLGWNPQSIRNAISAGRWQIPTKKLGNKLCISVADLAAWLDGDTTVPLVEAAHVTVKTRSAGGRAAPAQEKRGPGRPAKYPKLVVKGGA